MHSMAMAISGQSAVHLNGYGTPSAQTSRAAFASSLLSFHPPRTRRSSPRCPGDSDVIGHLFARHQWKQSLYGAARGVCILTNTFDHHEVIQAAREKYQIARALDSVNAACNCVFASLGSKRQMRARPIEK